MKFILSSIFIVSLFSGCANSFQSYGQPTTYEDYKSALLESTRDADYNKPYADTDGVYQNLNGAIVAIADQLLTSNIKKQANTSLILTSFVQLEQFNKTTTFGRLISESLFNELHIRKFKVTDFRGQDAIVVNANGEFHITRDTKKLKDQIDTVEYIVVGTYSRFENESVLINSRIMDSLSGEIISSARIIYHPKDCSLFDICRKPRVNGGGINIVTDNCATEGCPTQQCKSGVCNNLIIN
ncbi:MAG: hypothetical protein KAQ94_04190 [Arcobacteraceae bacterium]|nr:hypothetical protein [Arcobacteraceae bacterium]